MVFVGKFPTFYRITLRIESAYREEYQYNHAVNQTFVGKEDLHMKYLE